MRSTNEWTQTARTWAALAAAFLVCSAGLVETARAAERKYLVTLASSPKQYPATGLPPGGYVNRELVRRQYFEKNPNDNIGSFAEYWEEISYGDVTITGRVTDWILLPWPIQPPLLDVSRHDPVTGPPVNDNPDDPMLRISPANFIDSNGSGFFEYGAGEPFNNSFAATIIDKTGDPFNVDDGPYEVGPGSGHITMVAGHPVWKPGERFIDMDMDGRWDGFDEAKNWMDWNNDGRPDNLGPWVDLNGDGMAQAPMGCVFLPDSDNDGFPDCCPNGPNPNFPCNCPPSQWTGPNDTPFVDCNGDFINDMVGMGGLVDALPYVVNEQGLCVPGEGDGTPDVCQYPAQVVQTGCRDQGINCMDAGAPCCNLPVCPMTMPQMIPQRCEFHDANFNMRLDIVEPFENFLRRWDPCMFDPDVSSANFQTQRTHWVKVYDPQSPGTISCAAPAGQQAYNDPIYIQSNYPANGIVNPATMQTGIDALIAEAGARVIYGKHDPLNLGGGPCICRTGLPCVELNGEAGFCPAGMHADYNPADSFTNNVVSRKYQARGGANGQASFATATPEPGTFPSTQNPQDSPWYQQAWMDRYGVTMADVPAWPPGYMPAPGGGMGTPIGNSMVVRPFRDPEPGTYNAAVDRRFFKANFGGLNGNGTGWVGQCGALSLIVRFETGPLGTLGFETACNRPILPEETAGMSMPGAFYDGFVEHDDLPSSKYHIAGDQFLGEITSPFRTWYNADGSGLGFPGSINPAPSGDMNQILKIPAIWGEDRGDNNPSTPDVGGGDQILLAAGPYAHRLYGSQGRDAGNQLLIELLTWRTAPPFNNGVVWESINGLHHPYAGPGIPGLLPNENLGFRDYNLDGLIDIGESRPAGSENYLSDSDPSTPNNGTNSTYPFNRQRMVEDCIMILDEGNDFDDFVDTNALNAVTCGSGIFPTLLPTQFLTLDENGELGVDDLVFASGLCSGIVLLPAGAHAPNQFPIAPSFYPIHNEDGLYDPNYLAANFPRSPNTPQISWNIFFHDLVIGIDQQGEDPTGGISNTNFQTPYSAHEYLHSWEGFPDLYDYDVFGPPGPVINCPIGFWDIMAGGGLVHPVPILKEKPCTEWIKPVDLTEVLTPGVDTPITIPPYELVRDDSAFFLENENRLGERYYFWSVGRGFNDPFPIPIPDGLPATGLLIMRTDVGSNPDALPLQQTGPPFTYHIIAADGLDDGGAGLQCGDAGDPWPGITNNRRFNCNTLPASRWYNENSCTGLDILNIVPDGQGSVQVIFNWVPTSLPGIKFIDPPGGASVNVSPGIRIYNIRTEVTDVFGGTWIRFFRTTSEADRTIDPHGANYLGMLRKTTPGTDSAVLDWNIFGLPDDRYYIFAELIPGQGSDGVELSHTAPRRGRNNEGNGTLVVDEVETNQVIASGLIGAFPTNETFAAVSDTGQPVNFANLGVQIGDQLATNSLFRSMNGGTLRRPIMRSIAGLLSGGTVLQLSAPIVPPPGTGETAVTAWVITDAPRDARSEAWTIECTNAAGTDWRVFSSLTQPEPPPAAPNQDPYPHATTGQQYTSVNGAVKFTINAGTIPFTTGDRFTFVTTGISAPSNGLTILNGIVSETPTAIISATPLQGDPPLTVTFDGRASFDPDGLPLTYLWNFGDGTPNANQDLVVHTFQGGGLFTVTLRVTNPQGLFGESRVDINVTNNTPTAVIQAMPISGQARVVSFSGALSTDLETPTNQLLYEWNFGDGFGAGPGAPGDFITVDHFYGVNGNYVATLRVTDAGGKQDTDSVTIIVGNTLPIANITHTALQGSHPHTVTFNGINSMDPDGDPITIRWIWGDGTPDQTFPRTGPPGTTTGEVPHTYQLAAGQTSGSFNTRAEVCDNRTPPGCVMWPGVTVTVSPAGVGTSDPRAIFTVTPNPPILNQPATFDGRLSFDRPPGSLIQSYSWNFGDGSTGAGALTTHTYTQPGQYTISLTVADGETPPNTNTATQTVVVAGTPVIPPGEEEDNRPPLAIMSVNPLIGTARVTEFLFDASASTDPDGDALTYSWSFGDGESATGPLVTYVYPEAGVYQVRLTVRDPQNASSATVQSITVAQASSNQNPVARIATGPRTGSAPVAFTLDGRTSYDPDGDPLTFEWQFFSEGEIIDTLTGALVTRVFELEGIYEVVLVVRDGRDGVGSTSPERLTVTARVPPPDTGGTPEPPSEQDIPNSADQRPPALCGLGIMMSFLGSLVGLSAMAVVRRREQA